MGFRIKGCALAAALVAAGANAAESWQYYIEGSAADVETATHGLLVLQGGGDWVDENYRAMAERSGYGDFVVLRASGAAEYSEYIYNICRCDSVETIVFNDRQASMSDEVLTIIQNAEALFIAGGDQSRYVRFWKDSPVEDALNELIERSVPIGGTSAGMAILGEYVYSAMSEESLTSEGALADPFDADLTIARDFLELPHLSRTITDQHLEERDRMGRTVALLARLLDNEWTEDARGIAADRETSLHIDPATGVGRVFATADHETPYVYFLRLRSLPENPEPGRTLTTGDVSVFRAGPGDSFDLVAWRGTGGESYTLRSTDGELESTADSIYGSRVIRRR